MPWAERRLRILAGNRLEDLARALAGDLAAVPLPPFVAETIIVQSPGMRRWLTLDLARRLGCAASLATPFPSRFCLDLAAAVSGGQAGDEDPWSRDALAWRLFARLARPLAGPAFAPLTTYLRDDDPRRRWQLAQRIADRFDEYQLYRGGDLLAWEAGDGAETGHATWQAALWRELAAGATTPSLARRLHDAIAWLEGADQTPAELPPRVAVFAMGSLPPVFLDLLWAVARHRVVTIHLVSPTPQFWSHLRSPREQARQHRRGVAPGETGNPLLAGFGRQGRELAALLQQRDDTGQAWRDVGHHDPGTDSALHALQHDVLDLIDRGRDGTPPLTLRPDDGSLSVHACHSPVRELEVVRDQLFAAFSTDPTLTPDEVLVLVSDPARYAAVAAAVLGAPRHGYSLPVRVADRRRDAEDPAARALTTLIRLAGSRLTAPEVCDLLELDPVRGAAGIGQDELATLRAWIAATGIRWAADAGDRAQHGVPAFAGNTWRDGLDRLVAGAATGAVDGLVAGLAPWGGDTAGDTDLVGRFARWFDLLGHALAELRAPRPLAGWALALPRLMDALLDDEDASVALRAQVAVLLERLAMHGGDAPVDREVLGDLLDASLDTLGDDGQAGGFLTGGITVAALKPLRTIPARVIVVCGLDDGVFPRPSTPAAFDLIATHPRTGDRRIRDEDRQLLLDTLLAARDRVILTYVGRSEVDDAELPPSVCVAELLDWCDQAFTTADKRPAREHLVVRHPLQPFSRRYLDGSDARLFTYAPDAGDAAAPKPFLGAPLPATEAELSFTWRELAEAWTNPSRHFCRQALDLRFDAAEDALEEHEPLALNGLAAFHLRTWLVRRLRKGAAPATLLPVAIAQGVLPVDALGEAAFTAACAEAATLAQRLGPEDDAPPVPLDVRGEDWRLGGVLDQFTTSGLLFWRAGRVREQDLVEAWIAHLAAQVAVGPLRTRLVGLDRDAAFQPVSEASDILNDLAAGFRDGLSRPLPLFPRAGHGYVSQTMKAKAKADPLVKAWAGWAGSSFAPGAGADRDDPYIARCWGDGEPLERRRDEFIALAHRLWEPLLGALEGGP